MKKKTYDEIFKNRIKQFFEKFAIVKTEYEILRLPRKVDILVIEANEPIQEHVLLFRYFKKYNIIEFKSEQLEKVLYRIRGMNIIDVYVVVNEELELQR